MTASMEYETIWSMGGMTGIVDLDIIAKLDFLCDDIGLDTISTGVGLAVAMDAGKLSFGDGEAALRMVEDVAKGTEFGKFLGNGPAAVGQHLNHHRVPVVKGQSIAAYDPRGMQGNGVTYATCPMGADHTAGNMIGTYLSGALDPLKPDGQVAASRNAQISAASLDTLGVCLLVGGALRTPDGGRALLQALEAKLGTDLEPEAIPAFGMKALQAEREFNRKAGFTSQDDRLPEFFYKEPLPPHNKVFLVSDGDLDSLFSF
jgi:aldehyde:ferredoxin oxidoreductase